MHHNFKLHKCIKNIKWTMKASDLDSLINAKYMEYQKTHRKYNG